MAIVDTSEAGGGRLEMPEGWYRVRIIDGREKVSKKGAPYFNLVLAAVDWEEALLTYDVIMLGGPGVDIGLAKLKAMGRAPEHGEEIVADQLVGWEGFAFVREEFYNNKRKLAVDINANDSCGYAGLDKMMDLEPQIPNAEQRAIVKEWRLKRESEEPGEAPPTSPTATPTPIEDDDEVPF